MNKSTGFFIAVTFGLASFAIAFGLGSVLTVSTGIPLLGGLLNGVLVSMFLTIGLLSTDFWGAATVMWLSFSLIAIPTTTLGPPGIYKVALGFIAGVIWDCVYFGSKKNKWGLFIGAIVAALSILLLMIVALSLGFSQGAKNALAKYTDAIFVLILINIVVTLIGVYFGRMLYIKRISNLSSLRRLRGNKSSEF